MDQRSARRIEKLRSPIGRNLTPGIKSPQMRHMAVAVFGIVPVLHPLLQLSPASHLHRCEPRAGRPKLVGQSRIPSERPSRLDRIGEQVENHLVVHRRAGYDGMTDSRLRGRVLLKR